MSNQEKTRDKLIRVNREIEMLTGKAPYLYTSKPGDGQTRVVFQGKVCQGYAAGLAYIEGLRADAYREYAEKEGPFDREATDQVSMWICNDGSFYEPARALAVNKDVAGLRDYLTLTLNNAPRDSAAWYARHNLSDADMERIEWFEIASDLAAE